MEYKRCARGHLRPVSSFTILLAVLFALPACGLFSGLVDFGPRKIKMSEKTLYPNFTVSLHPMDMIRQNAQSVNDLAKWTELNYPVDAIRESGLFSSKSVQKDNYSADFHIASGIVTLVDVGCNGSGRWDLVVKVNFKVQDLYNGQMILDKNYDYESHDAISSCSTTTVTIGGVKSVTKTSEKGPSVNRAYPVIYEAFLKDLNETLKTAYWIERAENNRLFATTVPDIAAKLNAGQQDEAQAQILALLEKENINGLARVQVLQLGVSLFSQKDDYPQVKKYGDLGLQTIGKLAVGLPAHSIRDYVLDKC